LSLIFRRRFEGRTIQFHQFLVLDDWRLLWKHRD
jgi:hypothetical protein